MNDGTRSPSRTSAHGFLAADGADDRLRRLVATATDEDSFERVLEQAVRNHIRMDTCRTDMGAVLRALDHAVGRDDRSWLPIRSWAYGAQLASSSMNGDGTGC
jgi:hypothetical protein